MPERPTFRAALIRGRDERPEAKGSVARSLLANPPHILSTEGEQ
jgi:hypothetical protein